MSNVSKTKTLMIYDETANAEVATIRLHSIADEFVSENETNEKFIVSSVWRNKNYNSAPLRVEEQGKTFFNYNEGESISAKQIEEDTNLWNSIAGANEISTLIV